MGKHDRTGQRTEDRGHSTIQYTGHRTQYDTVRQDTTRHDRIKQDRTKIDMTEQKRIGEDRIG